MTSETGETSELTSAALALFRGLDDAAVVLDLSVDGTELHVVAVNDALAEQFGMTPDDFAGQPGSHFYPANEFADVLARVRSAVDRQQRVSYEAVRVLPQGRRVVAGTVLPVEGRRVVAFGRDVSAERTALERLEHLERLARIGSWRWNVKEASLDWSAEYRRVIGVGPEEPPTQQRLFELVHPDDRELVRQRMGNVESGGAPTAGTRFRIVRPDGEVRTLEGRAEVLRDADGNPVHAAGTLQDVTEQIELAAQLERARELERGRRQALELHDDVVQGLMAAWLALDLDEQDRARELVQRTATAVQRLVDDLLDLHTGPIQPGDLARNRPSNPVPGAPA